jgi:hypothetical protein
MPGAKTPSSLVIRMRIEEVPFRGEIGIAAVSETEDEVRKVIRRAVAASSPTIPVDAGRPGIS